MTRDLLAIFASFPMLASAAAADEASVRRLDRRSGASTLVVSDPVPTIDGLRVTLPQEDVERTDLIPWDSIARLEAPSGETLERRIGVGIDLGTLVWRGRERLRRGDAALAAAAFQEAGERLRSAGLLGGLLDRAVLEGRLRSEIASDRPDEVLAEAILAGDFAGLPGGRFDGAAFGPSGIDPATGLVPAVPPVGDPAAVARCEAVLAIRPTDDVSAARRRSLWLQLLGGGSVRVPRPTVDDKGAFLLWNLVRLGDSDAKVRESARDTLLRPDAGRPKWTTHWIRFFAGRASIEHAEGDEDQLRGVLDLLHVIADDGAVAPILRDRAMEIVADTLERLDRDAEAAVFESLTPRRIERRPNPEPPS